MAGAERTVTAAELLAALAPASPRGELPPAVAGLAYDSRRVRPGDWFFALPGQHSDGAAFAAAARRAGAAAVVAERATGGTPEVLVHDARVALAQAAARFYGEPSRRLRMVGITGTNGKTTGAWLTGAVLEAGGLRAAVLGTVGAFLPGGGRATGFTTPEAPELQALLAETAAGGAAAAVMEVSSHGLALKRSYGVAFDVTVFTNLSQDHLDFHGTPAAYLDAKLRLFDGRNGAAGVKPTVAVVHAADAHAGAVAAAARRGGQRVLTYAARGPADVRAEAVRAEAGGTRFTVCDTEGRHAAATRLSGGFNVENALAAWAAGLALGVPAAARAAGLAALTGVPGRLEPVDAGQPFAVYVDYAHTPDALARVLGAVRPLARGRVHVLFGAGGDRDAGKRRGMGAVAARLADRVVLTSDNPRSEDPLAILAAIRAGAPAGATGRIEIEPDRRLAIGRALAAAAPGDVVVLAGKGHETTQTVGAEVRPFDDRAEARAVLARLAGAAGGA